MWVTWDQGIINLDSIISLQKQDYTVYSLIVNKKPDGTADSIWNFPTRQARDTEYQKIIDILLNSGACGSGC